LTQLVIKWPFTFSLHPVFLHYFGKENQAEYALKYAKKREKHPQHY